MDWHKVYIKKDIVHPIARFVNLITPEQAAGLLIWFYDWRVLIRNWLAVSDQTFDLNFAYFADLASTIWPY